MQNRPLKEANYFEGARIYFFPKAVLPSLVSVCVLLVLVQPPQWGAADAEIKSPIW